MRKCPKCGGENTFKVSLKQREGLEEFIEVWKCHMLIFEDEICGYELPLFVEIVNGQLLRKW